MKLIPTECRDNGLFEITEILCILSICLMWDGMKSGEFESYLEVLEGNFNPFAPGDFAEKRVLKLVEWFSDHCHAIKS